MGQGQGRRRARATCCSASSLPILLPYGMHDIEAWSEAIGDGAWGKRFKPLGEKVRTMANLDHWACFQQSYREVEQLVIDIASGNCGEPPESIVMFGGDVHHCYVSEVGLPAESGTVHSKVWHAVCSGLRKELQLNERLVLGLGHTWIAAKLGRLLAAAAEVQAAAAELADDHPAPLPQPDRDPRDRRRRGRDQDRAGHRALAGPAAAHGDRGETALDDSDRILRFASGPVAPATA